MFTRPGSEIWRDYETEGVPASGARKPRKSEIREWHREAELLMAAAAGGMLVFATKSALDGDLAHPANTGAQVIADSTPELNGIYVKAGGAGAGSWSKVADAPAPGRGYGFASTSSITIVASGTVALTLETAIHAYVIGARVRIAAGSSPTENWMEGIVTSVTGADITVTVEAKGTGTGTYATWWISVAGDTAAATATVVAAQAATAADRIQTGIDAAAASVAAGLAAGYVGDVVAEKEVPIFGTIAGLASIEIPAGMHVIRVDGRDAPGDGWSGVLVDAAPGGAGATPVITSSGTTARDWYWQVHQVGIIGGAVRRYTGDDEDWYIIEDDGHWPLRLTGIETEGANLRVNWLGGKVGTIIAAPDETFAIDGACVGTSGGTTTGLISMGVPCSFTVDLDNDNALAFTSRYFDEVRFSVSVNSSTGLITIGHPSRTAPMRAAVVEWLGTSAGTRMEIARSLPDSAGAISLYLIEEAEGLIAYNGSSWVVSSSNWASPDYSFAWNGTDGELTVTHPEVRGAPGIAVTPLATSGSPRACSVRSVTSTGFIVKFHDVATGGVPTLGASLGFYFSRGRSAIAKTPRGKLHVFLGHVQVNMNHVDSEFGNLWLLGAPVRNG